MIKPASLWAFIKTADEKTAGRVMLALAGREGELSPPLNPSEICLVSVIKQDGVWMDENVAKRKQRVAEAVKAHRERKKAAAEKAQAENEPSAPESVAPIEPPQTQPVQPTQPPPSDDVPYIPTPQKSLMPEYPELKEVLAVTVSMGVPEGYARWWYKQMVDSDWRTTKGLAVNRRNWRAQLKAWHNRATPDEIDKINAAMKQAKKAVVRVSVKDWELCAERCANCANGISCVKGIKIPPTKDTPPKPPEECGHYYPRNAAKNGAEGAGKA